MKIMVVAGHPADMFDHCGGTLYNHIQRGDEVTCVSLTHGLHEHDEVICDLLKRKAKDFSDAEIEKMVEERQKVKYQEVCEACALFGITDIRFISYNDEFLTLDREITNKLASVMREVKPDMLITHWPYEGGGLSNHHGMTGQIAIFASLAASKVSFDQKETPAHIAQCAFMLSTYDCMGNTLLSSNKTAYATYYVDVTDVIDLKVKAIACMKSQKYDGSNYAKKTAERWNGTFGNSMRVAYAEAFAFDFPEMGKYLPLSEHRLWLANADEADFIGRSCGMQALDVQLQERAWSEVSPSK